MHSHSNFILRDMPVTNEEIAKLEAAAKSAQAVSEAFGAKCKIGDVEHYLNAVAPQNILSLIEVYHAGETALRLSQESVLELQDDVEALEDKLARATVALLWISPCGQGDYKHPSMESIGQVARAALKEIEK